MRVINRYAMGDGHESFEVVLSELDVLATRPSADLTRRLKECIDKEIGSRQLVFHRYETLPATNLENRIRCYLRPLFVGGEVKLEPFKP